MTKNIVLFLIVFFVLSTPLSQAAFAAEEGGKLDSFEAELDKKEEPKAKDTEVKKAKSKVSEDSTTSTTGSSAATEAVLTLFSALITGLFDMADTGNLKEAYSYLKENEIPALPTFKLEGNYQYLAGDMQSLNGRAEVGYLMFGLDGEYKRFYEDSPRDNLNMADFHFLVRGLLAEIFQVDLALGERFIWGDSRHQGFEIGMPFYLIFGKHFIWDVKPYMAFVGGKDIYDVSSGMNLKYKFAGFRAGYRGIWVNHQSLHGPEVGLFIQF